MEPVDLWCDFCKMRFSGPVPAQQHYQSAGHRKKAQNATSFVNKETYCHICNVTCDTVTILKAHEASPRHKAMVEKHNQLSNVDAPTFRTTTESDDHMQASGDQEEYVFNGSRGFCFLCTIELTSESHAASHLNGKNHIKKKNRKHLEFGLGDSNENLNSSLEEVEMRPDMFCQTCRVPFTGPDNARQHYSSEKHKMKVLQSQMEHGTAMEDEPLSSQLKSDTCQVSFSQSEEYKKHLTSQQHKVREGPIQDQTKVIPEISSSPSQSKCETAQVFLSEQHYESEKHKNKIAGSLGKNNEMLSCEVCNVYFMCADNKREHLASSKHRKNVEMKEREKKGNLLPLSCNICNCQFTGQENADAHFRSKKHKRNQENMVIQQTGTYVPPQTESESGKVVTLPSHGQNEWNPQDDKSFASKSIKLESPTAEDSFPSKPISTSLYNRKESCRTEERFIAKPVSVDNERFETDLGHGQNINTCSTTNELSHQLASLNINQNKLTDSLQAINRISSHFHSDGHAFESLTELKIKKETHPSLTQHLRDISPEGSIYSHISDSGTVHDEQPSQFIQNNLQPMGRGRGIFKISNLNANCRPGNLTNMLNKLQRNDTTASASEHGYKLGQSLIDCEQENEDDETKLKRFMSKIEKQNIDNSDEDNDTDNRRNDVIERDIKVGLDRPASYQKYQLLQYSTKWKLLQDNSSDFKETGCKEEEYSESCHHIDKNLSGNHLGEFNHTKDVNKFEDNNFYPNARKIDKVVDTIRNNELRLSTDFSISRALSEGSLKRTTSEGSLKGSVNQDEYRFSITASRGWCNVCNIELTSKNHFRQHILGRKHVKAREVWRVGGTCDVLRSSYRCDVCNVTFSGPEPQKQHFESQKHLNKARQSETIGEKYFCDTCNVSCSGESSFMQHLAGSQHFKMSGGRTSINTGLDNTLWYSCDVCNCRLNTKQQLEIHKKSPKHIAKAQKLGSGYDNDSFDPAECKLNSNDLFRHEVMENYFLSESGQQSMLEKFLSEPLFPDEFVSDDSGEFGTGKPVTEPKPMVKPEVSDGPIPVIKRSVMTQLDTSENGALGKGNGGSKRGQGSDLAWATRSKSSGPKGKSDREDRGCEESTPQSPRRQTSAHPELSENPFASTHNYYCRTCKVPMNTQESYEAHIRGKRHMAKVCNEKAPDRVHMERLNHKFLDIPKTKSVPRNYQIELYKKAVELDTLCFLPTGTGKTLVSVLSLCQVLREFPSKNVLFLVDKVLLVLQQSKYIKEQIQGKKFLRYNPERDGYEELIERHLNIAAVCMGQQSTGGVPMWKHDVVIVTAAFCKNLLDQGILRWTDFSLVIFDEAHHCDKSHPYSILLQHYHSNVLDPKDVPKILGLTASPAGKNDLPKTMIMLENLLANMGHAVMNIVEERDNQETLSSIQSNAKMIVKVQSSIVDSDQDNTEVLKRLISIYAIDCLKLMKQISNIQSYIDLAWINVESKHITPKLFEENIDVVQSCLGMIYSDNMEKVQFSLFTQHLQSICMAYNSLLEGGILCAIEEFSEMERGESNFKFAKNIGLPCDKLYMNVMSQGQTMLSTSAGSDMSHKTGTHIQSLISELTLANDVNQSSDRKSMSLVLVKQRGTAHKICTLLNGSQEMQKRGLKTVTVVGHGGGGAPDRGMTVNQQKRTLQEIKEHKYQVVIATSVAEEGVDWPECDRVISMYPPSTVTALVQMRGRARRKNSKFVILCENETEKEKLSDIMRRESNMMEATKLIVEKQRRV